MNVIIISLFYNSDNDFVLNLVSSSVHVILKLKIQKIFLTQYFTYFIKIWFEYGMKNLELKFQFLLMKLQSLS